MLFELMCLSRERNFSLMISSQEVNDHEETTLPMSIVSVM